MLNPLDLNWMTRVAIVLVLTVAALIAGFIAGLNYEANRRDAVELKATRAVIVRANKEIDRKQTIGAAREKTRVKIQYIYQKIHEEAAQNVQQNSAVYATCSLDDVGLRDWNAANAGSFGALPGKPDDALRRPAAGKVGAAQ
jgi:hypothetical protein